MTKALATMMGSPRVQTIDTSAILVGSESLFFLNYREAVLLETTNTMQDIQFEFVPHRVHDIQKHKESIIDAKLSKS
jgi:hypothetical protein